MLDGRESIVVRVTGYPTEWDESEGLLPVEIQDVMISATPSELRALASFLTLAASQLEAPGFSTQSIELPDSKPSPQTGISFMVLGVP